MLQSVNAQISCRHSTADVDVGVGHHLCGPALDLAKARIEAIAKGDVANITGAYGPDASLNWIGGPLDGSYASSDAISEVWTKFSNAQGTQTANVGDVWEATNPKGATVVANVVFEGKNPPAQ